MEGRSLFSLWVCQENGKGEIHAKTNINIQYIRVISSYFLYKITWLISDISQSYIWYHFVNITSNVCFNYTKNKSHIGGGFSWFFVRCHHCFDFSNSISGIKTLNKEVEFSFIQIDGFFCSRFILAFQCRDMYCGTTSSSLRAEDIPWGTSWCSSW
jgi:hypothetical protein